MIIYSLRMISVSKLILFLNIPQALSCAAGTYNSNTVTGQSSCTSCPPGTYNPNTGSILSTDCTFCTAGTYTDIEGQTTCKSCPAETFNSIAGSTTCHRNLIVNGDFELADKYCFADYCITDNQTAISPWIVTSVNKVFELDKSPWKAQSGKWSLDLCSDAAYTISQSVATKKGKRYKLTFHLNQNGCEVFNKTGFFSIGDDKTDFYYNSNSFSGWRQMDKEFIASSSTTVVSIGATNQGRCGPVVDNVGLQQLTF